MMGSDDQPDHNLSEYEERKRDPSSPKANFGQLPSVFAQDEANDLEQDITLN